MLGSRDLVKSVWLGHREQNSSLGDEDLIGRGKGRDRVISYLLPQEDFLTSGTGTPRSCPVGVGVSLVTTVHSSLSEQPQGQSTWPQILTGYPALLPAEGLGQGRFVPTNQPCSPARYICVCCGTVLSGPSALALWCFLGRQSRDPCPVDPCPVG